MSNILSFNGAAQRAKLRRAVEAGQSGNCEINIFPGIRYERWSDDQQKPTPQKKKRNKKRRLRARV